MYNIDANKLDSSSLTAIVEASRPSSDIKEVEGHLGEQNGVEGVDDLVSPTVQLGAPVPVAEVAGVNAPSEQQQEAKAEAKPSGNVIAKRTRSYLTAAQIKAMPDPSWLLNGLLPSAGLSVLYGAPKLGKSFLALDWGLSIANGCKWLGRATSGPGRVLYIAAEGFGGLGRRVRAWEEHYGRSSEDGSIAFPDLVVNLHQDFAVSGFLRELKEHFNSDPLLIVVDTLSKAMIGAEENSARDVNRGLANAEYIRQETGAAVLLVHHTTKSNDEVERGSTALRGAADVMLLLKRRGDDTLCLVVHEARDFEPGPRLRLRFKSVGNSGILVEAGAFESSELSTPQRKALKALATISEHGEATSGTWLEAADIKKRRFYDRANELCAGEYVSKRKSGKNTLYSMTKRGTEALEAIEL